VLTRPSLSNSFIFDFVRFEVVSVVISSETIFSFFSPLKTKMPCSIVEMPQA
jgi:hypothetical protein